MLSETIRRYPHIVDQQKQHEWADEVSRLERIKEVADRVSKECSDDGYGGYHINTGPIRELRDALDAANA